MNRRIRDIFGPGLLASVAVLLGLSTPASAAPSLGVTLERDEAAFPTVHHSDERVDLTVNVKNEAPATPPSEGDVLSCWTETEGGHWSFNDTINYHFQFRWLRDGVAITPWSPAEQVIGEPGANAVITTYVNTYALQAADREHSVQCLVKGTNGAGHGGFVIASQPAVVVNPLPAVAPPTPNDPGNRSKKPEISGSADEAGHKLSCTAPTEGWSASDAISPISWSFEWLRDGEPASGTVTPVGPTESEYELTAEDVSAPAAPAQFQCVAKATNAGGHPVVEPSFARETSSPAPVFASFTENGAPTVPPGYAPTVAADATSGPVTMELELPAGEETFAYEVVESGNSAIWACEKLVAFGAEPARVVCSSGAPVAPQQDFPALKVTAALGADAPDIAMAKATVVGGGAPGPVSDELSFPIAPAIPFGLSKFTAALLDEADNNYTQAGGHPFKGASDVVVNRKRALVPPQSSFSPYLPVEQLRQTIVDLPRGVVGNQLAIPELCPGVEEVSAGECPPGSEVGGVHVVISDTESTLPIYAIKPEFGAPAQFAFPEAARNVITFTPHLRAEDGYAISFEVAPPVEVNLLEATTTFCDFGAESAAGGEFLGCKKKGEPGANPKPLFTQPTRCGALTTRVHLNSWADPTFVEGPPFANAPITGCEAVPFEPTADLQPTGHQADSPTGLDVNVSKPTNGLEEPDGIAQSNLKQARITFPEGMSVNASAGQGLEACAPDQIKLGTNDPITCPESSKIGSVGIKTPVLEETLQGSVYVARQGAIEGATIGFYLVFDSPKNGILIKLPARVDTDPRTGQVTVTIDELPDQPFSSATLHFPQSPGSALLAPPRCGTYQIVAELSPWSAKDPENPTPSETVTQTSSFEVTQGPNGGPCPEGRLEPKLSAGSSNPIAGQTSPFSFRLYREDGTQRFASLSMKAPLGLTAYLKGIPYCPDSVIDSISTALESGRAETAHPSCPAASQIGTASAGAGAGPDPFYVNTGRVYLAGPYKGAPASILVVAPAVAGPLDLGNVVIRNAIYIDPESTQLTVASDPIPTILHGILPDIRDIRVNIDRPHFTLNPTSCEEKSLSVEVKGELGASASVSNRFQVGGCEKLGFKPKATTRLFGPTRRAAHPRLRGVLLPRPGDADLKSAVVTIPRSEFLDQAHIRTICTRVQFAAHACPKGSIYGHATATTPLLDYPLSGPVYLRSSNHKLPDLVATVRGPDYQPIEAAAVARVDSIGGQIRASFESIPDVPLSKVVIDMQGGKKGLLINSRNICTRPFKVSLELGAHNGAVHDSRPLLKDGKCGKGRKHKAHPAHRHG